MIERKFNGTPMIRKLRLTTGLILACFVTLHLSNHALGLIALPVMEQALGWFVAFWHQPIATALLYGALVTHFLLALWSLYCRTTLRMPLWEALQLLLGLSIPPLLMGHVIGTRLSSEWLAFTPSYETTIAIIWTIDNGVLRQTSLVVVLWLHLLIGLHYWQRLSSRYSRWLPLWQLLAALLPILSVLGFYRMGYQLGPIDLASRGARLTAEHPAAMAMLSELEDQLLSGYLAALTLVLLARYIRRLYLVNVGAVTVEHPIRGQFAARQGQTLLEALRSAKVPHSSVCGGRARCTTCRVRVVRGLDQLETAGPDELRALAGINADRNVRLACQLHLKDDLAIVPLIPPELGMMYVRKPGGVEGQEQQVTVLFIDLRDSTGLAEQRLPYDVVFILNQFFAEMSEVLHQTGGHYAQFIGDGLMALYGLESDYSTGCRQAILGAQQMLSRLQQLNQRLGSELEQPLRVGIGIHSGEAIVGTMGPPESPILSAIGDTINTAARIEAETKKHDVSLILSQETAQRSGVSLPESESKQIAIRGRSQLLDVVLIRAPDEIKG